MPHVTFVPFTGFRIREAEMLELGMRLPGLQRRASAVSELPALGLLTLAGQTPDSWTCSYRPAAAVTDELVNAVVSDRPDIVAVSALTASINEAYAFSRRILREGIPVIFGGLHVTACPAETLEHCTAVAIGSGELVWPQVLRDAEIGALARVYDGSPSQSIADWPLPRFDLLGALPSRFTLQTQRGCPLSCEFCGASRLLSRFREKPVTVIAHELEAISAVARHPLLELADDNTFAGKRDMIRFLDVLQQSSARWFTETDWRIGERPEILTRLAEAGCVQVLVGIESLVFRYPGLGRKQAELDRIMRAVAAIQDAGVAVNGCFIVGADGETRDSLERLVEFLLESPFAEVQVTIQTPFPGTELFRRLRAEGRLLRSRDWSHYTLFDVTYRPDCLSVAELERGFQEVLRQVFSQNATERRTKIRHEVWHRNARLRK